jgi:hypothetical protein
MALLNNDKKLNFDTTLSANYDANGDGTGLNPQPLQVDANGALLVSGGGSNIIQAQNDVTGLGVNLKASQDGNLAGTGFMIDQSGANHALFTTQKNDVATGSIHVFVSIAVSEMYQTAKLNGYKMIQYLSYDIIQVSANNYSIVAICICCK